MVLKFSVTAASYRFPYGGKSYTPDFVIETLDLAIDVKFCKDTNRRRQIIGEINDYILAFRSQFARALFVIYDVLQIQNTQQFVAPFQRNEGVDAIIVKH